MKKNPGVQRKNPAAQELGRLGGLVRGKQLTRKQLSEMGRKGGKQRAKNLSAAERKRIAKLGVAARERLRKGSS
jgi:general stress protein YciG